MVASTNSRWLQTAFDMLNGLSDWVVLKKNAKKTRGVVCHTCRAAEVRDDEAYTCHMMGVGRSYNKRQR